MSIEITSVEEYSEPKSSGESTLGNSGALRSTSSRSSEGLTTDNYRPHYSRTSVGAVDLGLSVLWADCNSGASSIDEEGDLYGWGEVSPGPFYSYRKEKRNLWQVRKV